MNQHYQTALNKMKQSGCSNLAYFVFFLLIDNPMFNLCSLWVFSIAIMLSKAEMQGQFSSFDIFFDNLNNLITYYNLNIWKLALKYILVLQIK